MAAFCCSLKDNGIEVKSVASLIGDKRLNIDLKTTAHLEASLKNAGLSFDSNKLAARLTRAEAGGLIMQINSARSENAKQKLPETFMGYSTKDLLRTWEEIQQTEGTKAPKEKIIAMDQLLKKYHPGLFNLNQDR